MISVIIPYIRPEKAQRCIDALKTVCLSDLGPDWADVVEIIAEEDKERIGCPKMVKKLTDRAKYDRILFLGDDTIPQQGMMAELFYMRQKEGAWLVALNDGIHGGNLATHWLADKLFLDDLGGEFFHTGYKHCFCDRELTDIAKEHGEFFYAENARIVHDHPAKTGHGVDADYARVYSSEYYQHDRKLYIQRKIARGALKLGIAMPITDDRVETLFFLSFAQLEIPFETTIITPKFGFHPGDIGRVRNQLVDEAFNLGCTHILFMDTDQVYHDTDLIPRLMAHDKPIVGGKVHRRWPPFDPILQRGGEHVPDDEIDAGGLVEVDATGTGCMLIRMDVFDTPLSRWFEIQRDATGEVTVGEDIGFCKAARAAGLPIYVDCSVNIGHLTSLQVCDATYQLFKKIKGVGNGSRR